MVTNMQENCSHRKGCALFAVHISSDKGKEVKDEFPKDITNLPPHGEVDFSIDLLLGPTRASKAPYRMSTHELVELKVHLKEMLDKG